MVGALIVKSASLTDFSIGQQFALTEASYATIRILQAFKRIEPRDSSILTEAMTLTMAPRNGVKVGLIPA